MTTLHDRRYLSIYNAMEELNKRGTIPSYRRKDLEDRLIIACKDLGRQPRAQNPRERKQILANSRENKAHRVYLEVLDENCHAFLPFVLAISPRACVSFNLGEFLRYQTGHLCRLDLNIEAKGLLDEIARKRGLIQSPHYEKLIKEVFPKSATLLRVIRFEKHTLQQIVLERPTDILGGIWFGSPPGFVPFVSLRLSRVLGDIIKPSGQEVLMPEPAPDASRTFTGVYSIELESFRQLIQRDGFGAIFWNEYGGEAFVAMQVMDKELIADFIQASQAAISDLPVLDTVSTGSST